MRRPRLLIATVVLASALGMSCADAGTTPAPLQVQVRSEALAEQIDAMLTAASKQGFRGAIIVEQKGRAVLRAGYGTTRAGGDTSFTPSTVAQIGSVTKPMTALAILQLAAAGKVDLQAPVKTYLPDAAEPAASATLHQLLTHHAGLEGACGDDFDRRSKSDLLRKCMARPLAHRPGEDGYSNLGYSILAAVIEQVSGQSWEDYLRAAVWSPLQMTSTGYRFGQSTSSAFAEGSVKGRSQAVISDRLRGLGDQDWNLRGSGGVQASADDMARFYRGLTGMTSVAPESIAKLMATPHEKIGADAWEGYGLALRLAPDGKVQRVGHSGSDGAFWSYFGWLPGSDTFFYIVGANGEDAVKSVAGPVIKAIQDAAEVHTSG